MPLNIKDDALHAQARELAALKGVTIADAVREAVNDKLKATREAAERSDKASVAELLAIAKQAAAGFEAGAHSSDHAELYDEDGLPR